MRIGLDGVRGLAAAAGWAQKKTGQHPAAEPPSDIRLWVNDASLPLLPHCHPWFDLNQHRGKEGQDLELKDFSLAQDRDIHPASRLLNGNQKTGWLGGWTYGIHCGLDLQLKVGTRLFCVTGGGIWRGFDQPDGPTQKKDSLRYAVPRPDGSEWWFGNAHCMEVKAVQGQAMRAGELFALSGKERAGIPHAHASIQIRKGNQCLFHLNPWPALWQGLRNLKAERGFPLAQIKPFSPRLLGREVSLAAAPPFRQNKDGLEYSWFFSDGTKISGPKVSKSFNLPGMHQIILVVRGKEGSDLDEQFFTIGTAATPPLLILREIWAQPVRPKVGQEVLFNLQYQGQGNQIPACLWDFGDGKTGEGLPAKHVFSKPGRYFIIAHVGGEGQSPGRLEAYELDVE